VSVEDIHSVAVVGSGTMGSQIAHVVALGGYPVRLYGRSQQRLDEATTACAGALRQRVAKGKLRADACEQALARVVTTTDLEAATAGADLLIKAIAEDREAKRALLVDLDRLVPAHCIVASNSSTIPSSCFADVISGPERLLNVHFFNPALVMQLVEVVRGPHTSAATAQTCMEFVRRLGKSPVLVRRESYGFIANRILFIAMQEAFRLLDAGVTGLDEIDLAVKNGLNWPMGPFELADLVGLDITRDILEQGYEQTGEQRWRPPRLLTDLVEAGHLGRKTGRGFYLYVAGRRQAVPLRAAG